MTTWIPAGPPALGAAVGADATPEGGWLVRPFRAGPGLDGPPGILQGGLAATLPSVVARLSDPFGAPLTSVTARLHAPTPLERELRFALRPADGVARHEVQLRDGDQLLVSATVELAGRDRAPAVPDLVELALGELPPQQHQRTYPRCFVCGPDSPHPHALRCTYGHVRDDAVALPWLAEEDLATAPDPRRRHDEGPGTIDPVVVGAALDCPGVWAATPALTGAGYAGCLLAGMEVRWYRDAPAYEPLRLVARHDELDGRKVRVRTALIDEDGLVHAVASALHIAVAEVPSLP
ncbi:MAG: hotdog fold domain-containing protein [Nitriliruptor sp.]|uniref:hotdog fold domain-containing protein n=1 Tax=Nitriliruptor sp. TaxID=2448056 RepID=UPI0034A07B84